MKLSSLFFLMKEISGPYYILDDELIPSVNFDSQFLSRGINLYEVLRFINKTPLFFEGHYSRLLNSSKGKLMGQNINKESLIQNIKKLLDVTADKEGNLKVVIHTDSDNICKRYLYQTPHFYPSENDYKSGVKLISLMEARPNPNLKRWRPAFKDRVIKLKQKFSAFDVLLVEEGLIREGSQSNFFSITKSGIITAPGEKVLKGITRDIVFQICKEEKINIVEMDFSMADLQYAEATFLTGTSPGILPVSKIDDMSFSPSHPILHLLSERYKQIIINHIT